MNKRPFKLLLLDLSNSDQIFSKNYQEALHYIQDLPNVTPDIIHSNDEAQQILANPDTDYDIFLMWLGLNHTEVWRSLVQYITYDIGVIIVFGYSDNVQNEAREAMQRGFYAFACPFNPQVLSGYIEATILDTRQQNILSNLEERIFEAQDLSSAIQTIHQELEHLFEYNAATTWLVNNYTPPYFAPYQTTTNLSHPLPYLDSITKEILDKTQKEGIYIHNYVSDNNEQYPWIGIMLEHGGQKIAIITLQDCKPQYYLDYSNKMNTFLHDFRRIAAYAIETRMRQRNKHTLNKIIDKMSESLNPDTLIQDMKNEIATSLGCDCSYFLARFPMDSGHTVLKRWEKRNDDTLSEDFRKGEGIAGKVLEDEKIRLIGNAREHPEFLPTSTLSGANLSMLVVPVLSQTNTNSHVIGVISCHKTEQRHYFTSYDRDLVEDIARYATAIVERTTILEYAHKIGEEITTMVSQNEKEPILQRICEYALRATSATEAVIHRIVKTTDNAQHHRATGEHYEFPTNRRHATPRLDRNGATNLMISRGEMIQFSKEDDNFDRIADILRQRGVKHVIGVPLIVTEDTPKQQDTPPKQIVGVLYLNKYSEGRFSPVEEFALNLFAKQAANAIMNQELLYNLRIWANIDTELSKATQSIAISPKQNVLHNIVYHASKLVNADFSYIVLSDHQQELRFETAWPDRVLNDLKDSIEIFHPEDGTPLQDKKKGITGLAARDGKTILIQNIEELRPDTEYSQEYIDFNMGTRSELAVPIRRDITGNVIGVLNLESQEPYAFTQTHCKVIELFASHAAIALQKNELITLTQHTKDLLGKLQQTILQISVTPSSSILHTAVQLTSDDINAQIVTFVPFEKKNDALHPQLDHIVMSINDYSTYDQQKNHLKQLESYMSDTYTSQKYRIVRNREDLTDVDSDKVLGSVLDKLDMKAVLYLPLFSGNTCMGVMWIYFKEAWRTNQTYMSETVFKDYSHIGRDDNIPLFQIYASQIALAIKSQEAASLQKQLKEAEDDFTKGVEDDYERVRRNETISFWMSLTGSILSFIIIILAITVFFFPNIFGSLVLIQNNAITAGTIMGICGVLIQAASVFLFSRANIASERMDNYHRQLFQVRQFNILLTSSDQLDSDNKASTKEQIITTAVHGWLNRSDKKASK